MCKQTQQAERRQRGGTSGLSRAVTISEAIHSSTPLFGTLYRSATLLSQLQLKQYLAFNYTGEMVRRANYYVDEDVNTKKQNHFLPGKVGLNQLMLNGRVKLLWFRVAVGRRFKIIRCESSSVSRTVSNPSLPLREPHLTATFLFLINIRHNQGGKRQKPFDSFSNAS